MELLRMNCYKGLDLNRGDGKKKEELDIRGPFYSFAWTYECESMFGFIRYIESYLLGELRVELFR